MRCGKVSDAAAFLQNVFCDLQSCRVTVTRQLCSTIAVLARKAHTANKTTESHFHQRSFVSAIFNFSRNFEIIHLTARKL